MIITKSLTLVPDDSSSMLTVRDAGVDELPLSIDCGGTRQTIVLHIDEAKALGEWITAWVREQEK